MTGILVDINTISYGDKKEKTLFLAVVQMGTFEKSLVISPAKAEQLKDLIEQEFNINLKDGIMYTKDGVPKPIVSLSLGSQVK